MTVTCPTITAELLAAIMDAAPTRVRKRLDREPNAASNWQWSHTPQTWTIVVGDETVCLKSNLADQITQLTEVSCSCLLAPKCFHVLACVTLLEIASNDKDSSAQELVGAIVESDVAPSEEIDITDAMRRAAVESLRAIDGVMVSGARASGLLVQSSLLRAAHQSRAEGLLQLSAALIRMVEGIQRLRRVDDHTDCEALRRDAVAAINAANELLHAGTLTPANLGYSRRPFSPVKLKRLYGVLAEPILTLSGYAGVVTHLLGDDGQLYQIVETRPGDANLIGQAYRGGIDLGRTTTSAQVISRSRIDVQNLTCSPDGRLGKGSRTRWAIEPSSYQESVGGGERWTVSLADQVTSVFDCASEPDLLRHGGWDLVCVRGKVLGANGSGVAFEPEAGQSRLTLGISIDDRSLPFRENLQMLARCPGLEIEVLGRVRLHQAGWINALSFHALSEDIMLPDAWGGRCHLGLDELKRHHFKHAERFAPESELVSDETRINRNPDSGSQPEMFPGLDRRCTALMLGGRGAVGSPSSATHRRDRARLISRGQLTAARMLDGLALVCAEAPAVSSRRGPSQQTHQFRRPTLLAASEHYLRASRGCYEREKWMRVV